MSRFINLAVAVAILACGSADSNAQGKLKGVVGQHLKKVEGYLKKSEKALAANNLRDGKMLLGEAEKHWKTFQEWNVGKYDPNHPQVVAVAKRIKELRAKVAGEGGARAAEGESLGAVLKIITENLDRLNQVNEESRGLLRGYTGTKMSFGRGRADLNQLRQEMEGLRPIVGRFNDLLPPARAAAVEFRNQFPNKQELSQRFGRDGYLAFDAAESVASYPERWLSELKMHVDDAFQSAQEGIARAESKVASADGRREAFNRSLADDAEMWALGFANLLLDFPEIAFPELSEQAKKILPEFDAAREEYLARIGPLRKRIDAIDVEVGRLRKLVVDADLRRKQALRRQLEAARFPQSDEYKGGEWELAEQEIRKAWAKARPDRELLRFSICSGWEDRREARFSGNTWVVGTYRYIEAYYLGKLREDEYFVYRIKFRKTGNSDGKWGELSFHSTVYNFRILSENINK